MEGVADEGEGEEGQGSEREDGGDGGGGLFFVGVDGTLGGDDGGDSADGGTDAEEDGEAWAKVEGFAEPHHEDDGEGKGDEDKSEGEATEFEYVSKDEACAEQDDAGLEPELVGGDTGAEDAGYADGVGDDDAEENGPEDVFDVGEGDVVGFGVGVDGVLDEFAGVADHGEERDAGQEAEEGSRLGGIG